MKREYHIYASSVLVELKTLKENNKAEYFKEIFMKLMPEIKAYIAAQLKTAIKKGIVAKNRYKVDDFVNDLYIYVYEHINSIMIVPIFTRGFSNKQMRF
tara:strand:- start:1140 stop:1436 length:297 start_codon:yes stop_codon:yes gene_type:complete